MSVKETRMWKNMRKKFLLLMAKKAQPIWKPVHCWACKRPTAGSKCSSRLEVVTYRLKLMENFRAPTGIKPSRKLTRCSVYQGLCHILPALLNWLIILAIIAHAAWSSIRPIPLINHSPSHTVTAYLETRFVPHSNSPMTDWNKIK